VLQKEATFASASRGHRVGGSEAHELIRDRQARNSRAIARHLKRAMQVAPCANSGMNEEVLDVASYLARTRRKPARTRHARDPRAGRSDSRILMTSISPPLRGTRATSSPRRYGARTHTGDAAPEARAIVHFGATSRALCATLTRLSSATRSRDHRRETRARHRPTRLVRRALARIPRLVSRTFSRHNQRPLESANVVGARFPPSPSSKWNSLRMPLRLAACMAPPAHKRRIWASRWRQREGRRTRAEIR
jgi:hypothetical protein